MFIHNFQYSLKILLKNKQLVFWTLAFPLIMAILFNMAFSDIENSESFDPVSIAVVDDDAFQNNEIFSESLESLSEGEDKVFDITYANKENAEKMLEDGEITGYLQIIDNEPSVVIHSNGINETIFCYVIDEINSDSNVIRDLGMKLIMQKIRSGDYNMNFSSLFSRLADEMMDSDITVKDTSPEHISFVMIEYYTLIAMACMYSGLLSMTLMNYRLANVSAVGKRSAVSPAKKGGIIMGSLTASFLVQLAGLAVLYLLMIFYIKVDFGNNLPMIILLSLIGSLAGLSLGVAVGVLIKAGENAKLTALIAVVMAGCFFSGMMGVMMKNIIDKNAPIINYINPVAMITDGFYTLYYYNSLDRFYFDIISLLIFSAVMILISLRGLRRQRYDSI